MVRGDCSPNFYRSPGRFSMPEHSQLFRSWDILRPFHSFYDRSIISSYRSIPSLLLVNSCDMGRWWILFSVSSECSMMRFVYDTTRLRLSMICIVFRYIVLLLLPAWKIKLLFSNCSSVFASSKNDIIIRLGSHVSNIDCAIENKSDNIFAGYLSGQQRKILRWRVIKWWTLDEDGVDPISLLMDVRIPADLRITDAEILHFLHPLLRIHQKKRPRRIPERVFLSSPCSGGFADVLKAREPTRPVVTTSIRSICPYIILRYDDKQSESKGEASNFRTIQLFSVVK